MNVKELDKILRDWGKFWASRESLQGYASTSVTERCCQVLRTGIWASSDKHLFSHQADQVFVPDWVKHVDECVSKLEDVNLSRRLVAAQVQRAAINRQYIKQERVSGFQKVALLHAKSQLLALF